MIRWRRGVVRTVRGEWDGALDLEVTTGDGEMFRGLAYPGLVGAVGAGDRVLLNTTAVDLGLGTGGYALVVAVEPLPDDLPARHDGHMVKARYTPLQTVVDGAEERYPEAFATAAGVDADAGSEAAEPLAGLPVVVADLHSALPAVLAGVLADRPAARVAYLMTDGGALPMAFSRTVAALRSAGWLAAGTVTVGQAYGGDLECVTVHSGLIAARRVLGADVVVVTQGPGNLGTGTTWGFSGVAAGEAVNAAALLGGRPIAALRVSAADERPRHRGLSHHSLTAYGRVATARAVVPVPELADDFWTGVAGQAAALAERHEVRPVPVAGLIEALRGCPVPLSTMGRGLEQDTAAFLASACAGRAAAGMPG